LTQNKVPDIIINAKESETSSIMLDFKSLCSSRSPYKHIEGKFGGGVEVPRFLMFPVG
jgi:hypothetical protein